MANGKWQNKNAEKEKTGISEIVGEALLKSGETQSAYRALRQLLCARCVKVINKGEYFTRKHLSGISMPISPRCQDCVPFELRLFAENEKEPKKEKSKLLSDLLDKKEPETTKDKTTNDEIEEKFLSRLGPVLEKTKRKK